MKASGGTRKPASLLGLGFDNDDGHVRMTRGKNYALLGGSHDTHAVMQETAVKINEKLDARGKSLAQVSACELREICREVRESIGYSEER